MRKVLLTVLLFSFVLANAQFQNSKNLEFTWKTDTLQKSVPLSEIQIVLPKGSFPTIDNPSFVSKSEGLEMFFSKEPVIALNINGEAKAYPLNILTMHEIANDEIGGEKVLVTYCPLCNSAVVYDRLVKVDGKSVEMEFEASGMLRNSDMVMLDRATESLWQQLTGEGIVGTYTNTILKTIPSAIISVEDFFIRYPFGQILSKNTGFEAAMAKYGNNPYEKYDERATPVNRFFNSDHLDKRLPAMERVIDIEENGHYKIYPFSLVKRKGVIQDVFKGTPVVLFYKPGAISVLDATEIANSKNIGTVTVFNAQLDGKSLTFSNKKKFFLDKQTKSKWDITGYCFEGVYKGRQLEMRQHGNHFAFAWLAFHPESKIYTK